MTLSEPVPVAVTVPRLVDSSRAALPERLPYKRGVVAVATPDHPAWERHTAQVSLVPPLSSNWLTNSRSVNTMSVNLLVGYAAGVDGVEVGGLINIVRDSVRGAQAAGLINAAGGSLDGVQLAGIANLTGGPSQGWQNAGLVNVAGHRHGPDGTATAEPLWQMAGLLNSAPGGIRGAQMAGLINLAGKVQGAQIAGLLNNGGKVKGLQLAGLLNVADTVDGVSFAPLNFVRHGYHVLELATNNTWPLNLTLKLGGSPIFYTYFTGALLPSSDSSRRWGFGYGVGSELGAYKRFSVSIDAQAMQINEDDGSWETWGSVLNMQNQLRIQAGWAFGRKRKIRLMAGPTLNMLFTERVDPRTGRVDSDLFQSANTVLDNASATGQTRIHGWFEITGGVRWRF